MLDEDLVDELLIDGIDVRQKVGDAVGALEIEGDTDIAELEIQIDQGDGRLAATAGEGDSEVRSDRRAAHAPLRAVHRDHGTGS